MKTKKDDGGDLGGEENNFMMKESEFGAQPKVDKL